MPLCWRGGDIRILIVSRLSSRSGPGISSLRGLIRNGCGAAICAMSGSPNSPCSLSGVRWKRLAILDRVDARSGAPPSLYSRCSAGREVKKKSVRLPLLGSAIGLEMLSLEFLLPGRYSSTALLRLRRRNIQTSNNIESSPIMIPGTKPAAKDLPENDFDIVAATGTVEADDVVCGSGSGRLVDEAVVCGRGSGGVLDDEVVTGRGAGGAEVEEVVRGEGTGGAVVDEVVRDKDAGRAVVDEVVCDRATDGTVESVVLAAVRIDIVLVWLIDACVTVDALVVVSIVSPTTALAIVPMAVLDGALAGRVVVATDDELIIELIVELAMKLVVELMAASAVTVDSVLVVDNVLVVENVAVVDIVLVVDSVVVANSVVAVDNVLAGELVTVSEPWTAFDCENMQAPDTQSYPLGQHSVPHVTNGSVRSVE